MYCDHYKFNSKQSSKYAGNWHISHSKHRSRVCKRKYAHNTQAQRVFKTAPLFAQTNPDPTAPQSVIDSFTQFFESLWNPTTASTQKAGMSYVYDEDGTLIAQTLTGGAQTSWGQSAKYIYLPTASGPMPVAAIYGTKHYAIQSDHLNTPRRLIQSDGQVAWQWAYSAFGEEKPTTAKTRFANADLNQSFGTTAVPAVTFNLRYPGQYFDQESGLHYNYHRSYSATVGRYTQADPIGLDGGWNRFNYAELSPLEFTDPEGLSAAGSATGGRIGGAVGAALGGRVGAGAAGRALGTLVGSAIGEFCTPDDPCPPCKTISGKTVKAGTIAYRPLDKIPENEMQHGVYGSHHNIFVAGQNPRNSSQPCRCHWDKQKYVLKPFQLTPDMIPIEPFAY